MTELNSSNGLSVARGREEIRTVLADRLRLGPTLVCHEIDVVENDDLAVLRAPWTFSGTNENGESFERHGRSIEIVRRQPYGAWRSNDLPSGAN